MVVLVPTHPEQHAIHPKWFSTDQTINRVTIAPTIRNISVLIRSINIIKLVYCPINHTVCARVWNIPEIYNWSILFIYHKLTWFSCRSFVWYLIVFRNCHSVNSLISCAFPYNSINNIYCSCWKFISCCTIYKSKSPLGNSPIINSSISKL